MKKALYVFGCAALVLTLTACGNPKTKDGEAIIAEINGKSYTADELYKELKGQYGYNTVMTWVDTAIAEGEVETTDEIKQYADEAVEFYSYYAEAYGMSLTDFCTSYLGINGITSEDDLKEYVVKDRKLSLAIQNRVASKVKDSEAKEYYEKNYKTVYTYKDILIADDDDAEDNIAAVKKALKDKKGDKLVSAFEEAAKKYSEGATAKEGGVVKSAIKPNVDEAVWKKLGKLSDGEYTKDAVKGDDGYHIIMRVSKDKAQKFEDVKEEIKNSIAEKKLQDDTYLNYDVLTELRNKYKLTFYDSDLKKSYKDYLSQLEQTKKEASNSNKESNSNKK